MLTDHQLTKILSTSAPQGVLARILRQPVLWQALHEDAFLRRAIEFAGREENRWRAGLLGLLFASEQECALAIAQQTDHILASATLLKAEAAWKVLANSQNVTLDQFALAALTLRGDPSRWAAISLCAPYAKALAACWYALDANPSSVLVAISQSIPAGYPTALATLLGNEPVERATQLCVQQLTQEQCSQMAQTALECGDDVFADLLASQTVSHFPVAEKFSSTQHLLRAHLFTMAHDPVSAIAEAEAARTDAHQTLFSAAVELARASESRHDDAGALTFWQEARSLATADLPAIRMGTAQALSNLGRAKEAQDALSPSSDDPSEMMLAAKLHLKSGESSQALDLARKASQAMDGKMSPSIAEEIAAIFSAGNDPSGAARILAEAARQSPGNAKLLARSAEAEAKCSNWEAAGRTAFIAWHIEPAQDKMLTLLAHALNKTGHHAEALDCRRELAILRPDDPEVLVSLAQAALEQGERKMAHEAAEHALRIYPESGEAHAVMGMLQMAEGNPEAAFVSLQKAVRIAPSQAVAWKALSDLHLAKGNRDAAVTTLRAGMDSAADPAELMLPLGQLHISEGKYRDAVAILERASSLHPDDPETLTRRSEALLHLQRTAEAEACLAHAIEIAPADEEAILQLVPLYTKSGKLETARTILERALASKPDSISLHTALGELMLDAYRAGTQPTADTLPFAMSELRRAVALSADSPHARLLNHFGWAQALSGFGKDAVETFRMLMQRADVLSLEEKADAHCGMAEALIRTGETSSALASLQTALLLTPNNIPMRNQLGKMYLESGLAEEALIAYRQCATDSPSNSDALIGMAHAHAALGRHSEALASWRQLTELHPENATYWLELAECSLHAQEPTQTRTALAQAVKVASPQDLQCVLQSSRILAGMKEYAEACSVLEQAAPQHPSEVSLWTELGTYRAASGQHARAHEAFRRAVELQPDNAAHLQHAAEALWADGRRSSAVSFWKKAAQLDPSNGALVYRLATALTSLGIPAEALAYYEKAIQSSPEKKSLALEAAHTAFRAGDFAKAEEWERLAVSSEGASVEGLVLQARIAVMQQNSESALAACNQLTAEYPEDARGWALLAHSLAERISESMDPSIHPDSAKAALQKALARCAVSPEAMQLTAEAALRLQDPAAAVDCLQSIRDALPDDADALALYARSGIELAEMSTLAALAGADTSHTKNAPTAEEIRSVLARVSALGGDETKLQPLFARAALAFSTPEEDTISHLEALQNEKQSVDDLVATAIAWWKAGNPMRSAKTAETAVALFPASARARYLEGALQYRIGNRENAMPHLQDAIARAPYWSMPHALAAIVQAEVGQKEAARAEMRKAIALAPEQAAWQHLLGCWLDESGDAPAAIASLQHAAKIAPQVPEYQLRLARALASDGDAHGALIHYRLGISALPAPSGVQLAEIARVALEAGSPSEAYESFRLARERQGADAPVEWALGQSRSALALGRMDEAKKLTTQLLQTKPSPEAHILLAEIEESAGHIPDAIKHLDIAASEMSDPLLPGLRLARLWTASGLSKRSVMALQALTETYPDNDEAQHLLGEALAAEGKMDEALRAAQKASELGPRRADHWRLQGRLARQSGQLDQALASLARAREIASGDFRNNLEIGSVYEAQHRWDLALDSYRAALKQAPESTDVLYRLGVVHKNMRSYNEAASVLRKVVQLEPKHIAAHKLLSGVMALSLVYNAPAHTPIEAR
jgi:tetratricopeptide (TPR) repeat protein